jgi:lysyl-tRNA synthetase class II
MVEHVNSVTLAMTGELTSRVFSKLIHRYGEDAATSEKLQRLEMLLIKTHSAAEASEKRILENSWLLQWRDKLKEAASQGDKVLARFLQKVSDAQASSSANANQQQGEAASSSDVAPATVVRVLSFARNSLSGIVEGIRSTGKTLFASGDDDMERLNKILAKLEKLSPGIAEFIRLLHLEALPNVVQVHVVSLSSSLTT